MASPAVLDLPKWLTPLNEGGPAGINLRDVGKPVSRALYEAIRACRQKARSKENPPAGSPAGDPTDDWRSLLEKAADAFCNHSKDFEVATYVIEANTRIHGFSGLRDSFALYRGLMEQFWDTAYPPLEQGSGLSRVTPLGALNGDSRDGVLIAPILRIPITNAAGAYGLFHYQHAVSMDAATPAQREARRTPADVLLAAFEASARNTPAGFYQNLREDLQQCQDEFDKLRMLLKEKFQQEAPATSKISSAIQSCLEAVGKFAPTAIAATDNKTGAPGSTDPNQAGGTMTGMPNGFRDRDQAFEVVSRVAEFFRKTEPQSPVIFALEQAVRWGKMPLPELLTELINDESTRNSLFRLVGIRPPANPNS